MGLIPDWVKEFPGQFWKTLVGNAQENLPEFKEEVIGGVKAVLQVPAKVVQEVIKPLNKSLIVVGIVAFIALIFWNKISKKIL